MKFFCEYCGCRIDANKDAKCPNCGASYKKNKTYLKLEEERETQKQKINEVFEQGQKNAKIVVKAVFIVFIVIFVTSFIFIISSMIRVSSKNKETNNIIDNPTPTIIDNKNEEKQEKQPQHITVGMNEYAKIGEYQVMVTGYEVVTYWYKEAKKGYEYVKFNLQVENLTDKRIYRENVNCIVDGIAQTNDFSSGYSTIPMFIESNLVVKGESTFEVPKNTNSYDIRYGDYATIHIEK